MEQKIISQNEEQCIYFIKETNLEFYLIIPNYKQVNIVLGLFPNITESEIKTLPKEKDKALVIPVITDQILTSANHLDNTSFKYIDNVLSYLINVSYKILTHNNITVAQKILLNNHSLYTNFNQQYIEKYQNRVELYNLIPKTETISTNNQNEVTTKTSAEPIFKPVEPPFSKPTPTTNINNNTNQNPTNTSTDTIEDSIDTILSDEPIITSPEKKETHEPGFVSYVLLGVLVAVITLVFIYIIL